MIAYVNPIRRNLHREVATICNLWLAAGNTVTVFPKGRHSSAVLPRKSTGTPLPYGTSWSFFGSPVGLEG